MNKQLCPQCGNNISEPGTIRCPRCNKLLLTPCGGSCGNCQNKGKCSTSINNG